MKIALPDYFSPQPPDRALSVGFRQQPQPGFHSGPLGTSPAAPHGLPHQAVVDINICAHA
jgi:hypothetical protein